eukprot:2915789-Pyramimonas_sp.AAC.1
MLFPFSVLVLGPASPVRGPTSAAPITLLLPAAALRAPVRHGLLRGTGSVAEMAVSAGRV